MSGKSPFIKETTATLKPSIDLHPNSGESWRCRLLRCKPPLPSFISLSLQGLLLLQSSVNSACKGLTTFWFLLQHFPNHQDRGQTIQLAHCNSSTQASSDGVFFSGATLPQSLGSPKASSTSAIKVC
ncbi:hypothetical protein MRB53_021374 [Persea americana]|uniref:Uncharacterized protein n=1 Tax=Persea americana TaxID=3435 RepID=A0ACC2L4Q3_PERAE|nr:hypothetical protein MRB53_021374 [Persea americana]